MNACSARTIPAISAPVLCISAIRLVQLRTRFGIVEGELGRADQTHERVRDLVQSSPCEQADCQK